MKLVLENLPTIIAAFSSLWAIASELIPLISQKKYGGVVEALSKMAKSTKPDDAPKS